MASNKKLITCFRLFTVLLVPALISGCANPPSGSTTTSQAVTDVDLDPNIIPPQQAAANTIVFEQKGRVHLSTHEEPRRRLQLKQFANQSFRRVEVEIDFYISAWHSLIETGANQFEIFTVLRNERWSTNAIGYLALDVRYPKVNLVNNSNLNLPAGAGTRIAAKAKGVTPGGLYHLKYTYNTATKKRISVLTDSKGVVVSQILNGVTTANAIVVAPYGLSLVVGGEDATEPGLADRSTEGWEFSNLVVRAEKI